LTIAGQELAVLNHPVTGVVLSRALTNTEAQIVSALVSGHSNAQIAMARGRSTRTVGNQVAAIFRKLGVRSRAELLALLFAQT
jgi:DNA-binding NarL/FixJ family response regulator